MWATSTEGEWAPLLLPSFTTATGIPVHLQSLPATAAHQKLLTAYAGGSLPDVMMLGNEWIGEFAMLGALRPAPPPLLADQFPGVLQQVTIAGTPLAVPWVVSAQVQYWRRDLFAAAGIDRPAASWPEWTAQLRRLKARGAADFGILLLLNWPEPLLSLAASFPEPLLRERATRGNFANPGFIEALGFYKSLFDEGLAPRVLSTEIEDPLTAFARGWFAILPDNPTQIGFLSRRTQELPRARWATATMPGPAGLANGLVGGNSLAVPHTARDPARAWQLVAHLTRPPQQIGFFRMTGDLPSRPSAWRTAPIAGNPALPAFAQQLPHAKELPNAAEWPRIRDEIQRVAEQMVRGGFDPAGAAREMDRRADRILAKRRALVQAGTVA